MWRESNQGEVPVVPESVTNRMRPRGGGSGGQQCSQLPRSTEGQALSVSYDVAQYPSHPPTLSPDPVPVGTEIWTALVLASRWWRLLLSDLEQCCEGSAWIHGLVRLGLSVPLPTLIFCGSVSAWLFLHSENWVSLLVQYKKKLCSC